MSTDSNNTSHAFAEFAECISSRVDPQDAVGLPYIGLEHIDSGSLDIVRWGQPEDVKGTKLRAYKGDLIFGKRRAYQRKIGIAAFDCICSAHALVLREIPGPMISGLLPYFMHSDVFTETAVSISEGSLSPTLRWSALAEQRFFLPSIEVQKELLENVTGLVQYSQKLKKHEEDTRSLIRHVLGAL
jgi:type I restriction enzyme S subunit